MSYPEKIDCMAFGGAGLGTIFLNLTFKGQKSSFLGNTEVLVTLGKPIVGHLVKPV